MGKGKKKVGGAAGSRGVGETKALRNAVEAAVNEAVAIQDSAIDLPPPEAAAALQAAAEKYRGALRSLPGHAEAAHNLATCLSEQADLKVDPRDQVALLSEARDLLLDMIRRDTSGRGATTALAHHTLGNIFRAVVDVYREHCPTQCAGCSVGCLSVEECKEQLRQSCRHLEEAVAIEKRLQNPSGGMDEVLVHWGDTQASMMQLTMDGASVGRDGDGRGGDVPPPAVLQEALALCSSACDKYSQALSLETSSGGSDADILRLKAGAVVDFLDWALPETPQPVGSSDPGFSMEALLTTGEEAVGVLLGLDSENVGGLLAKGDLCRLRARGAMLSGAGTQVEGRWREESVQWFSRAVGISPDDEEALTAAGEGSLEYGRRSMEFYREFVAASQSGHTFPPSVGLDVDGVRMSAIARLQEAGSLLSRVSSVNPSDTDAPFNAACAFALAEDERSCMHALIEYCRRLTAGLSTSLSPWDVAGVRRELARRSLLEAGNDRDLASVSGAEWFVELLRNADAMLAGGTGAA